MPPHVNSMATCHIHCYINDHILYIVLYPRWYLTLTRWENIFVVMPIVTNNEVNILKVKVKYLRSAFQRSRSFRWPGFACPFHGAEPWHSASELPSLSMKYLFCGPALTDTMDNLSEMCPHKLTDFCLFLYHQSYTILQGQHILPMAFTSCHDQG